jgi:thymidylate synthase
MDYYKPDKYKILKGDGKNAALCTCWFDPFVVEQKYPQLKKLFAITGTLYSKEGVSIILRNLALNPSIRYLFVWSNTPLSNTPFGIAGRGLLKSIWQNEYDPSGLHKEISKEVISAIVKNVELVEFGSETFEQMLTSVSSKELSNADLYMDPVMFVDPKRDGSAPMNSEKVGWVVRGPTIYNAWLNCIEKIMRYGSIKSTEYGSNQRELQNINWVINGESFPLIFKPVLDEKVLQLIGIDEFSLNKYKDSLLDPFIPEGTAYTYGSRLRQYSDDHIDQIESMISKLQESIITRRSVAVTLVPAFDMSHKSPPCLIFIQALIDDEKRLNLFATFRSHDTFKAGIPNAFGLLNLQEFICSKLKVLRGVLSITGISAHIYEEDWSNANDLLKCQKWSNIKINYDEKTDTDPRGIVKIFLASNKINLELCSLNGECFYEDSSSSSRDILIRLAKLELLSNQTHYADISIELLKAEIALQTKREYVQDRPLKYDDFSIK